MLFSVVLNDKSREDIQRYIDGKHANDVRSCSVEKKFGAIALKISQYRSYKV